MSKFVRHAVRVQEQLARMHAELQKSQAAQTGGSDASSVESPIAAAVPPRRSLRHADSPPESPREPKRIRLESGAHPSTDVPQLNAGSPAVTALQAPIAPVARDQMASEMREETRKPKSVDVSHADSARLDPVANLHPAQLPPEETRQPISLDHIDSSPIHKIVQQLTSNGSIDDNHAHTKGASQASWAASTPEDWAAAHRTPVHDTPDKPPSSSTSVVVHPTQEATLRLMNLYAQHVAASRAETQGSADVPPHPAMGFPVFTRQPVAQSVPPSPPTSAVPGVWAIQVGGLSTSQDDITFEVDQHTANSVHRWATRWDGFDPAASYVAVHLLALPSGGLDPQTSALGLRDLQPQWPDDGTLVLHMQPDQPGEQCWFTPDLVAGQPLDVSHVIRAGTNSLRILQLKPRADLVFVLLATPPTSEMINDVVESERKNRLFHFRWQYRPGTSILG
ncbi:hypothetical protein BC834DRAFT_842366 [Gloeopeniophorella convolvens]|nr:hypothetical protein BC834DRAFT_842366 [Gloeopeniophorella convolvens]